MATLVVYDSLYGNTERIAKAIARGLGGAALATAATATAGAVAGHDLVVVGGPTHRFGVSTPLATYLAALPEGALRGAGVAAFDTRIDSATVAQPPLRFLMRALGGRAYAAPKVAAALQRAGGRTVVAPEGFLVGGTKGPLTEGELDRAEAWGRSIAAAHVGAAVHLVARDERPTAHA